MFRYISQLTDYNAITQEYNYALKDKIENGNKLLSMDCTRRFVFPIPITKRKGVERCIHVQCARDTKNKLHQLFTTRV